MLAGTVAEQPRSVAQRASQFAVVSARSAAPLAAMVRASAWELRKGPAESAAGVFFLASQTAIQQLRYQAVRSAAKPGPVETHAALHAVSIPLNHPPAQVCNQEPASAAARREGAHLARSQFRCLPMLELPDKAMSQAIAVANNLDSSRLIKSQDISTIDDSRKTCNFASRRRHEPVRPRYAAAFGRY